ncbi:MAG: AAA family ATPase [Bacteroidota bacterium]
MVSSRSCLLPLLLLTASLIGGGPALASPQAEPDAQRSGEPDRRLRILGVQPDTVQAGGTLTLLLQTGDSPYSSWQPDTSLLRQAYVTVGGRSAWVLDVDQAPQARPWRGQLEVRVPVPDSFYTWARVGLTYGADSVWARGPYVQPPRLRAPHSAWITRGAPTVLAFDGSFERLADQLLPSDLAVYFDGEEVPVLSVTPAGLEVAVPASLALFAQPEVRVAWRTGYGYQPTPALTGWRVRPPVGVMAGGLFVLLLALGLGGAVMRARRRERDEPDEDTAPALPGPREGGTAPFWPVPAVPDALLDAVQEQACVLYAGAGLSARSGYPVWPRFVDRLLAWTLEQEIVEAEFGASLQASLEAGESDRVVDALVSAVEAYRGSTPKGHPSAQDALQAFLRYQFLAEDRFPSPTHLTLSRLPLAAALTTNLDPLIEEMYVRAEGTPPPVFTARDASGLKQALQERDRFILKLYGDLNVPDSVLLAPAQYLEAMQANEGFAEFMNTLFVSRTLFFVGASLDGILTYLDEIKLRSSTRRHYALVAVQGTAWRVKAEQLGRRYGIEVLPYTETEPDHPQVDAFLDALTAAVEARPTRAPAGAPAHAQTRAMTRLQRLTLEHIGPFESLELELDLHWNILLGNNGVGKSTILKAIALGLSDAKAHPYAERLLQQGQDRGVITLTTTSGTAYVTELVRGAESVAVRSSSGHVLLAEGWLALGFPPARTVGWRPVDGPQVSRERIRSRPDDLTPLLDGEPDPRLDKLKQWLVNLDYRITRQGPEAPEIQLREDFFQTVLHQLTGGLEMAFNRVDTVTGRVMIQTADGELPMEAVSQGTASLLGWVGVLIRRLYEFYEGRPTPRHEYALVLVDELDAHMHPAWQQALIQRLADLFPEVQFLVTTHSPLIVAGRPAEQIYRFARTDEGAVDLLPRSDDMTMGRADQILTSRLFGLDSTLDGETEALIEQYRALEAKPESACTEEDRMRLRDLRQALDFRIPPPSETPTVRHAQQIIDLMLKQQMHQAFGADTPELANQLRDSAHKLLEDIDIKRSVR